MFEQEQNLETIINYILETYHEPLKENLPILEELIAKIIQVHWEQHKEFYEIQKVFIQFKNEMLEHLKKEENILFPMIIEIENAHKENKKIWNFHCGSVSNPISRMEFEHGNFENYLSKIRELTSNYNLPIWACKTYTKVFEMLQILEKETLEHANLENEILHKLAIKKELEIC